MLSNAPACLQATSFWAFAPFKADSLQPYRRTQSVICQSSVHTTSVTRREVVNVAAIGAAILPSLVLFQNQEAHALGCGVIGPLDAHYTAPSLDRNLL